VCIGASEAEDGVIVEISDDGPGFAADALPAGHGLAALRARLEALHGAAGRLTIERREARTVVRLHLPRRSAGQETGV
jgi:signal transduction histidine kinase